jgi:hypothetical protein
MENSSDDREFLEWWIDKTNYPLKVMFLLRDKQGNSRVYDPDQNSQLVFLSFTYEEARLWLVEKQYKFSPELSLKPLPIY